MPLISPLISSRRWLVVLMLICTLMVWGCGPARDNAPTSEATSTSAAPTAEAAPVATEAAAAPESATNESGATIVEFWTFDHLPERIGVYEAVAARFMAANPGVEIRMVPKDEATIYPELIEAANVGQMPDLVMLGVERLPGLASAGWVDEQAASAVIRSIGIDDFRAGSLEMVTNLESQQQWAIPFSGWLQAIWYRKDVFDAQGLSAPSTWDQINAACDALTQAGTQSNGVTYAIALPSAPDQNYGHQVFEQIAISNQAWPLALSGEVTFNTPEMIDALRFFANLQRCSAPGPLSAEQAADYYLNGEAAMIFYSTYFIDDMVLGGQRPGGRVVQPNPTDLAQRTSFASGMVGPKGSSTYGQMVALAITQGADSAARDVARFFSTDGYLEILGISPMGKIPQRHSMATKWTELSPVFANYSAATLGHIANGFDNSHRWVLRGGYTNNQRAVISDIESQLLIPQALDKILKGEFTPESAAEWLQAQTQTLIDTKQ